MVELRESEIDAVSGGLPPAAAIVAVAVVKSTAFRAAVTAISTAVGAGVGSAVGEAVMSKD